jgi:hypothetical protein
VISDQAKPSRTQATCSSPVTIRPSTTAWTRCPVEDLASVGTASAISAKAAIISGSSKPGKVVST